jgi:hypothetical protein
MLYVSLPVSAVERPGMLAALLRSRALTRGHRVAIGLLQLLPLTVGYVLAFVLVSVAWSWHSLVYLHVTVAVLLVSSSAAVTAVAYHRLRIEKDGAGAHDLATTSTEQHPSPASHDAL